MNASQAKLKLPITVWTEVSFELRRLPEAVQKAFATSPKPVSLIAAEPPTPKGDSVVVDGAGESAGVVRL